MLPPAPGSNSDRGKSAICGGCNRLSRGGFKRCSGCTQRMYCSPECQKRDWPNHKEDCKKMKNARGEAPKRSNPVFTIARKVNQYEPLLEWVDYVLIATFDLVNHPENALTRSVSLFSEISPTTPGSRVINGKQNMTLQVVDTIMQPSIEPHCVEMARNERQLMLLQGKPAGEVDKLIWANFQWQPCCLPCCLHLVRIITPEKIEAFKSLTLPVVPRLRSSIKSAAKYIEYLNHQLRLPEYADIATTNAVVSDYRDAQDRSRALAMGLLRKGMGNTSVDLTSR